VLDRIIHFLGQRGTQEQDRSRDAAVAECHALGRVRDAEPLDAERLELARRGDEAVAIGVGLYHREHARRAWNQPAQHAKIVAQGAPVDLNPATAKRHRFQARTGSATVGSRR
jgi:hypothetical protein